MALEQLPAPIPSLARGCRSLKTVTRGEHQALALCFLRMGWRWCWSRRRDDAGCSRRSGSTTASVFPASNRRGGGLTGDSSRGRCHGRRGDGWRGHLGGMFVRVGRRDGAVTGLQGPPPQPSTAWPASPTGSGPFIPRPSRQGRP